MKGEISNFRIALYNCSLYLPEEYKNTENHFPAAYILGMEAESLAKTAALIEKSRIVNPPIIIGVEPRSWEDDFTPWPAAPLSKRSPFTGGAADFLHTLQSRIKPEVDLKCRTMAKAESTAVLGYSLGGLAALFALFTQSPPFAAKFASVSGSLWYEGWDSFIRKQNPLAKLKSASQSVRIYISLGDKEPRTKNPLMSKVGQRTDETFLALKKYALEAGVPLSALRSEWNPGGHFCNSEERTAKAVEFLFS